MLNHRNLFDNVVHLEMGIEPPFWRSANVPGGDEFNKSNLKKYSPRIKML